jgi:hypothetical protein
MRPAGMRPLLLRGLVEPLLSWTRSLVALGGLGLRRSAPRPAW